MSKDLQQVAAVSQAAGKNASLARVVDRTGAMVEALQDAGYPHAEIIHALLFEAGWMIDLVVSGEVQVSKAELRSIIGDFSEICAGLVAPKRTNRPDRH